MTSKTNPTPAPLTDDTESWKRTLSILAGIRQVRQEMREEAELIVGEYFICVYGRWAGSYKILATNENEKHNWLTSGVAENGYVQKDQSIQYYY